MILSTTPTLQGHTIRAYLGIVSSEAILGANIVRDFFASITDVVGGRSGAYEQQIRRAQQLALDELTRRANELGANAVVGIDLDYETVGGQGSMLMVTATGTAVRVEPDPAR